ncbi:MAG: DUF2281 domain-containing protein [Nitrospinota bacterium]
MLSTKIINDEIISELKELSEESRKAVLEYIECLKNKRKDKTIRLLRKTSGAWKGLIDAEKLKCDIYSNRLISTRSGVKF